MITTFTGTFRGRPARVTITDGKLTEGETSSAACWALGVVRAGGEVSIPGVWAGIANLDDPWALRALFFDLLDDARVDSDEPPPNLTPTDSTPNTVF